MEQYFICPRCHKKVTVSTNKLLFTANAKEKHAEIKFIKPLFSVVCDRCQEDMFECDKEMIYPVIGLNQKGYETHSCCAGHHININPENLNINELYSVPYIVFIPGNAFFNYDSEKIKDIYGICTNISHEFELVKVEISKKFINMDGIDLESIYIYAYDNPKYAATFADSSYKWVRAKREFFEFIDKLIETLPNYNI